MIAHHDSPVGILRGTVVLVILIASTLLPLHAITKGDGQGAATPTFEVASVKPNTSGDLGMGIQAAPGGLRARNVTVRLLVRTAYRIQESQLTGGPDWLDADRFDIVAKAESNMSGDQLSLMLRALLADRFKLIVHTERREHPVYALVVARSDGRLGPHLQRRDCTSSSPTPGVSQPLPCDRIETGSGRVTFRGASMSQIAQGLSGYVGRVVLDRTELSGNYDFTLEWMSDQGPSASQTLGAGANPVDSSGPSIFTALSEQLGLKLQAAQGPIDVWVIDRVEHPLPN